MLDQEKQSQDPSATPTPPQNDPPVNPKADRPRAKFSKSYGFRLAISEVDDWEKLKAKTAKKLGLKEPVNDSQMVRLMLHYAYRNPYYDFPSKRDFAKVQKIYEKANQ